MYVDMSGGVSILSTELTNIYVSSVDASADSLNCDGACDPSVCSGDASCAPELSGADILATDCLDEV